MGNLLQLVLPGQPEEAPLLGSRTQAYSYRGYSSFLSSAGSDPSCKVCGANFVNMAREQTLLDCKKILHDLFGPCLCLFCQRFQATAFQWEELIKMKVKDLRDYFNLYDISTKTCLEKEVLGILVLGQQPVISQEGRTQMLTLSQDFLEQQTLLTQTHASTVPPTSPRLLSSPSQATFAPPAQAQEIQPASGHASQFQEPVYLESTARAPAEDEPQSITSENRWRASV